MNQEEIKKWIPHRTPFLWLDEVVEMTDTTIHARTTVTEDLPVFQGHHPEFPVLPGVLQCEMCFQAAAVLIAQKVPVEDGEVPVATRLNNTKFRRLVRPGETLDIKVEITERLSNAFFLKGVVSVEGQTSTRCEFACASAPSPMG